MKAYNKRQAEGPKEDEMESKKSVSKVKDDDEYEKKMKKKSLAFFLFSPIWRW